MPDFSRRKARRQSADFQKMLQAGWRRRYGVAAGSSAADLLLGSESAGLALDFLSLSAAVRGPAPFRGDPNGLLTYSSPSIKYVRDASGLYVPGTTLRTDYGVGGSALGLLIEEQRTNLFLNSLTPATQTITVVNGTTYTVSLYATGGTLTLSGAGSGTVNPNGSATFVASGTSLTVTVNGVTGAFACVNVEAGSYKTSPIATTGSSATRAADIITLTTSAFPFSATAGTLFLSAFTNRSTPLSAVFQIDDGTNQSRIRVGTREAGANINFGVVQTPGVLQAAFGAIVPANNPNKVAMAYATNDAACSLNGGTVQTDTTVNLPTGLNTLRLGSDSGAFFSGWIGQAAYFPRRMTDAELIARTA